MRSTLPFRDRALNHTVAKRGIRAERRLDTALSILSSPEKGPSVMRQSRRDRGAVAVEFALLSVPLIMLTFGIIYFGWAFHTQTVLDNAARDAVRAYTLSEPAEAAVNATDAAADSLAGTYGPNALSSGAIVFASAPNPTGACPSGQVITMTLVLNQELPLNGMFGWDLQLQGSGSMQCTA